MDILIKNGLVVDGTGNPGFYAGVGVQGETVVILRGDYSHIEAARVIDAAGKVVCPGFIDMHAHTGLVILAEPEHHPKVRQGITTELVGVDGNSYAPFTSHDDFLDFVELNSGLDGSPPLPGRWSTVAEYLSMFDNKVAVNIAYVIGNSPIRICAMGWDEKPATDADLANMRAMLREGLEEGAFGLSTGLDYPPGSYADTDELVSLAGRPPDWVASITPTCATPSAIGFWTRLKRRWRSAKEGASLATSLTFISGSPIREVPVSSWTWWRGPSTAGRT